MQSITIGKNITGIGESAFSGCNGLTALQFEDSESNVGLGEDAFAGCAAVKEIMLENGFTDIDTAKDTRGTERVVTGKLQTEEEKEG